MALICREATDADRARVVGLLAALLGEHTLAPPRATLETGVAALIADPRLGRVLVAASEGEILGVAVLTWTFSLEQGGRSAWLDEIFVEPQSRGRGIGAALLGAVCEVALRGGACAIDLEVESGHERVATLYERHGFARHERQRWFLQLPRDGAEPASVGSPAPGASDPLDGGCLCGAVRYRITAPSEDVGHCHCSLCRRSSGAAFVTWMTVPASALEVLAGTPARRRSTPGAERSFCAGCGTALFFHADDSAGFVDVTAASLDHPERAAPREHIFVAAQLPWISLADDLPRFAHDHRRA